MRSLTEKQFSQPRARRVSIGFGLLCTMLILTFAMTANAQNVTELNTPTTTQLWAGTTDFANPDIGLSSLTLPASGVILTGTAPSTFRNPADTNQFLADGVTPNPNFGKLVCQEQFLADGVTPNPSFGKCLGVRHLWYGDASNGFCRVDPEVDDPDLTQPKPGIGKFNNIITTCVGAIQAGAFAPMQAVFDASTNTIYAADIPRTANGLIRMHFIPNGDNGQGAIDPIHVESLMGNDTARNGAGGCPVVVDPRLVAQTPFTMTSATLGPDGNIYIGWARNGSITRIPHPATFDPSSDVDCASIQVVGFAPDARFGNGGAAGHTFGLAFIGHTMFGADNIAPWFKDNFDQCDTAANGFQLCGPTSTQGAGTEILGAFVPGPQAGIVSDFTYNGPNTTFPGNTLLAMTLSGAARIINVTDVANMSITPNFGGSFCFLTGGTIDTLDLANETYYLGVDCTQGSINGAAAIYKVTPQPPTAAPPGIPVSVTASNTTPPGTPATGSALVSFLPTANGQSTTGYLIRTVFASDGVSCVFQNPSNPAPGACVDQFLATGPTQASVTGLPIGTAVLFLVASQNAAGTSQFSAPSAPFTAFIPTVPGAPTGVVATAGSKSAQVAWTAPASNGGLPITGYTVTAQLNGTTPVGSVTVGPTATGVNYTGLLNGSTYNFVVVATNAAGNSAPSLPSNAVTPTAPNVQDLQVTMTTPKASVNAGSFVTFVITTTNLGPGDAPNVTLADAMPANFVSASTTQGACGVSGAQFNCTFGGILAGGSVTVQLTLAIGPTAISNSATATLRDLQGNQLNQDPNLTNNTASQNVGINSGTGGISADIQIVGSAQNGGPSVGASDLFTWQIKNNTGNATAPNVSFEAVLPISFTLVSGSLSANQGGSCSVSPATPSQGQTLSCLTSSLPGGQTMIVTYNVTTSVAGTFGTLGKTTSGANDTQPSNNSFNVNIQPK